VLHLVLPAAGQAAPQPPLYLSGLAPIPVLPAWPQPPLPVAAPAAIAKPTTVVIAVLVTVGPAVPTLPFAHPTHQASRGLHPSGGAAHRQRLLPERGPVVPGWGTSPGRPPKKCGWSGW